MQIYDVIIIEKECTSITMSMTPFIILDKKYNSLSLSEERIDNLRWYEDISRVYSTLTFAYS